MTPVKFIEAVDSYFVYSTEALFTKVHEFIELFRNNNTVLGCLAVDTWQPSDTVSVGMIKRSPNMPAGVAAKATAGGETSTTEPTWPTTGTVSDGGVVWKMIPQSGMETATQAEVTTGTDTEKAVTPATAAGCYLRIWQGTTAPTDLSGRTAWLNTNTDPAALYYYNTAKSAWQSAVAYAAGAGTSANANYATSAGTSANANYATSAGTSANSDYVNGKITPIVNDDAASNLAYTSVLQAIKSNSTIAPNNGVILIYGNSTSWFGELFIGDSNTQGVYFRGRTNGTLGKWKKLAMYNENGDGIETPSGVILK